MDKNREKTVLALRELAIGGHGRSETAQLRDIIDEVEAALSAGVKREFVLDTLRQSYGFKMSMSGFEKSLSSIRKERKKDGGNTNPRHVKSTEPVSNQLVSYTQQAMTGELVTVNGDLSVDEPSSYKTIDKIFSDAREAGIKNSNVKKNDLLDEILKRQELKKLKQIDQQGE